MRESHDKAVNLSSDSRYKSSALPDAERKIKSGAVEIDGVRVTTLSYTVERPVVMRVGRKWKRIEPAKP